MFYLSLLNDLFIFTVIKQSFSNVYFVRPQDHSEECCVNYYKEEGVCKGIVEQVYLKSSNYF